MANHIGWRKLRSGRRWLCLTLCLTLLLQSMGCTRRFFRTRADGEVESILTEKDQYPQWQIDSFHVYPDARARFADPSNPDRPFMPPDDPAAYELSPHPQKAGKGGVKRIEGTGYLELLKMWDSENRKNAEERTAKEGPDPTAEAIA